MRNLETARLEKVVWPYLAVDRMATEQSKEGDVKRWTVRSR
jgi:hypothetical protein